MTEPLVSVVIPTFNRSWRVQRAVESALLQTHRRVQVEKAIERVRGRRRARALALLLVAKLPVRLGSAVRRLVAGLTRPFRRGAAG